MVFQWPGGSRCAPSLPGASQQVKSLWWPPQCCGHCLPEVGCSSQIPYKPCCAQPGSTPGFQAGVPRNELWALTVCWGPRREQQSDHPCACLKSLAIEPSSPTLWDPTSVYPIPGCIHLASPHCGAGHSLQTAPVENQNWGEKSGSRRQWQLICDLHCVGSP